MTVRVKQDSAAPVGVFDSGVGGLSVLRELREQLPHQTFIYLADTAHVPYGSRSGSDIRQLTLAGVQWLRDQGVAAVVVACNTASAYGLEHLRQRWPELEVVGLEPAVKPAAEQTKSGVVGVMATPATLRGARLKQLVRAYADPRGVEVLKVSSPELVPLVERGAASSPEARALLRNLLRPLAEAGADQLVLGCTHYPFLAGSIREEFGGQFALVDSGKAVARRTRAVLTQRGLLAAASHQSVAHSSSGTAGTVRYFVTGNTEQAARTMSDLTGEAIKVLPAHYYNKTF